MGIRMKDIRILRILRTSAVSRAQQCVHTFSGSIFLVSSFTHPRTSVSSMEQTFSVRLKVLGFVFPRNTSFARETASVVLNDVCHCVVIIGANGSIFNFALHVWYGCIFVICTVDYYQATHIAHYRIIKRIHYICFTKFCCILIFFIYSFYICIAF